MQVAQAHIVGIASFAVRKSPERFLCPGLGSCIGICGLDPVANVGGIGHFMLPRAPAGADPEAAANYVDTGLCALYEALLSHGAEADRLVFAAAGGAQLFKFAEGKADIGQRNVACLTEEIERRGLRLLGQDFGDTLGRSLTFAVQTGEVLVRTLAGGERTLCSLRS